MNDMRKLMEMVESGEYGSVPTSEHDVEIDGQGIILYEDQVAIYDESGEYQIFLPIETWRAFVKADNQANESLNEAVIEPTEDHQRSLSGMKELIENFEWRLEGMAYQLKIQGHEASAASVMNIEADVAHIKDLFDAALADLGKKYDRPGGWPDNYRD